MRGSVFSIVLGIIALSAAGTAFAASAPKPSVPPGFTITKIAAPAPASASNCDDLAFLEGHLFMGCQNTTLSTGGGGNSTLIEYGLDGTVVKTWSIRDKIDGMNGDPLHHRVIVTLDEDANSHLATITPSSGLLTYYTYSPDPHSASTPTALHSGGGTDQVSVDSTGEILVTASHAGLRTATDVFRVTLTPPSSPTGTGIAALSPTFLNTATAANGNTGSGTVKLGLGDVDSGAIIPKSVPKYGGGYVVTDQTAVELVFANNINAGTGLTALKTQFGLDDILWTTSDNGTLYLVDKGPTTVLPKVSPSVLYKVTGPFKTNTVLAANDGVGEQVVTVNLANGKLTPFVQHLETSKGLVYLNPDGTQTQLPLNGDSASSTATSTTASNSTPAGTTTKSSKSDDTTTIILIIIGVLILAGAGYLLAKRKPGTG